MPRRSRRRTWLGTSALVFVSTTGNVLPEPSQRAALEGYIRGGGGFLGVHAASDMGAAVRTGWPFYRQLVGAAFLGHTATHVWADAPVAGTIYEGPLTAAPPDAESFGATVRYRSWEPAYVDVEDVRSPAMRGWGQSEVRVDEWYGFRENPRAERPRAGLPRREQLRTVPGRHGPRRGRPPDRVVPGVRGRQVGLHRHGPPRRGVERPQFLRHILGGIEMAAGEARFDCSAVSPASRRWETSIRASRTRRSARPASGPSWLRIGWMRTVRPISVRAARVSAACRLIAERRVVGVGRGGR